MTGYGCHVNIIYFLFHFIYCRIDRQTILILPRLFLSRIQIFTQRIDVGQLIPKCTHFKIHRYVMALAKDFFLDRWNRILFSSWWRAWFIVYLYGRRPWDKFQANFNSNVESDPVAHNSVSNVPKSICCSRTT